MMTRELPGQIREAMRLRALTLPQLRARFGRANAYVDRATSYGNQARLTEFHNPKKHPARFFFLNEDAPCDLVYLGAPEVLPQVLEAALGKPDAGLPSRAGKAFIQYVHGAVGVAHASSKTETAFVEVFHPMSVTEYQKLWYAPVGPFYR